MFQTTAAMWPFRSGAREHLDLDVAEAGAPEQPVELAPICGVR